MSAPRPVVERFMEKIAFWQNGECWEWTAAKNQYGYGQINVGKRHRVAAHRWAYDTFVAPVGADDCVLHRCDNPSCVNPDHLWIGTRLDNMRDMVMKGRSHNVGARSRLTEDDVRAIRADTRAQDVIAKEYGLRQSAISRIKSGVRWGHVA